MIKIDSDGLEITDKRDLLSNKILMIQDILFTLIEQRGLDFFFLKKRLILY